MKTLPTNPDRPLEIKEQFSSYHELKQSKEGSVMGETVAHQKVNVIYSVQFTESRTLEHARFEMDHYEVAELVIHNEDGTIPTNCPSIPIEEAHSLQDNYVEMQLQKKRFESRVELFNFNRDFYSNSYADMPV